MGILFLAVVAANRARRSWQNPKNKRYSHGKAKNEKSPVLIMI